MPYGFEPAGWSWGGHCHPYWHHHCHDYWHHWGWPTPEPYRTPWQQPTKDQELSMLKEEASLLEANLADVRKRLQELEK